jgi:hypothetical protein
LGNSGTTLSRLLKELFHGRTVELAGGAGKSFAAEAFLKPGEDLWD